MFPLAALSAAIRSKTSGGMSSSIASPNPPEGADVGGREAAHESKYMSKGWTNRSEWLTCMFPSECHQRLPAITRQDRIKSRGVVHQVRSGDGLQQQIQILL